MSDRFAAPDSGPDRVAYACSFHAFRLADGRTVILDLVRSDDTGRRGLRAYVAGDDGSFRALIYEAPSAAWAPFATEDRPALDGVHNVLGRGEGWIAGRVDGAGPDLDHVAFDLTVEPLAPGRGVGKLGLVFAELVVTDYPEVQTRGWVELGGERHAVDAAGSASVHYGSKLCEYAYLISVPRGGDEAPGLLYAAARGDDLRVGGALLGGRAVGYAYGRHGVPEGFVHVAPFQTTPLLLGEGADLELSDLRGLPHELLGLPTISGSAEATYVGNSGMFPGFGAPARFPLGRVIFDARGDTFARAFTR
jgi:hypothetical protein